MFETMLKVLERMDGKHYVRTSFKLALEQGAALQWLKAYRPHVFLAFGEWLTELHPHGEWVAWFEVLDAVPNESPAKRRERQEFHRAVSVSRPTLFLLIQRAEAWIMAARIRRKRWGGKRVRRRAGPSISSSPQKGAQ